MKPTPEEKCECGSTDFWFDRTVMGDDPAGEDGMCYRCSKCGKKQGEKPSPSPEARVDWEKEAREIYNCKQCNGTGSYVGSTMGNDGEEEPVEVQCDCYSQILYQITSALSAAYEKGREAR